VVIDWYVRWRITNPSEYSPQRRPGRERGRDELTRVVRNAFQENINKRTVRDLISVRREALMSDGASAKSCPS
jgi:membrane protease subunit HflC